MSLIALLIFIILIVRSRRGGHSWPINMLTQFKRSLLAMLALAGLLFMVVVGIGTTRAILNPVAEAAIALLPE